jgi:hypothetical protein
MVVCGCGGGGGGGRGEVWDRCLCCGEGVGEYVRCGKYGVASTCSTLFSSSVVALRSWRSKK